MSQKRPGKCKTSRHELKHNTVVPFPGRTPVHQVRHSELTVDQFRWFRFRLKNGFTGAVLMSEQDLTRILRSMRQPDALHAFAVFDTPTRRIGLNLRHTACAQADGHLHAGLLAETLPDTDTVDVIFSDSKEPLHIEVEPNDLELSAGDYEERTAVVDDEATAALVQVAMLFSHCESMYAGGNHIDWLQDVCRSRIWIRLDEVALLSAPLGHVKGR